MTENTNAAIRSIVARSMKLPVDVAQLADDADLYDAGMTSFDSVQLMLALEDAFNIEFPERMLNRKLFASIAAIEKAIDELTSVPAQG